MPIRPGYNPNAGRPAGVRNRLSHKFLTDLLESWNKHGVAAIEDLRVEDPVQYVKVVASCLPKEMLIEATMTDLSDTDLDEFIAAVKHHMLERPQQPMRLINGKTIDGSAAREVVGDVGASGSDQAATRDRK